MSLETAKLIADRVRAEGGRALIVGGWVRDALMSRTGKDVDIEVYGYQRRACESCWPRSDRSTPSARASLFTRSPMSTCRCRAPNRRSVEGTRRSPSPAIRDLRPEEAARRRDFTINAIAWDPLTGEYIDPYGGREDLTRGVLKAVDARTFPEDSLRVLRAIQFAARFSSSSIRERASCAHGSGSTTFLPSGSGEKSKSFSCRRRKPSIGLALALELGVLDQLFPEIKALVGCAQEPEWHPEGDVWVHTLMVVDEARPRIDDLDRPQQITVMLGAVCHDLGKPPTTAYRRRPDQVDRSRAGGRRAGGGGARSPQHPHGRRV